MNRPNSFISNYRGTFPAASFGGRLINGARSPFWLAPMAGITDICYRQLMDEMGAGVLVSELVSAKGLLYNSGKTHKMIEIHRNAKSLVGIQLFGESEEDIINAAHYVENSGAAFVDINLGCPVKKVVKKGSFFVFKVLAKYCIKGPSNIPQVPSKSVLLLYSSIP